MKQTRRSTSRSSTMLCSTATNDLDYLSATNVVSFTGDHYEADTNGSGALTFVAGESFKTINVQLLDDALGEGNETFFVTLSAPQGPDPGSFPTSTLLGPN